MADDIESLKAQIASLTRENQRLTAENTRRKQTNRDLQGRLNTATADLSTATKERDGFKTKAEANPSKNGEELESLRTQVRAYKHKDGLAELAYSKDVGLNKSVPIDRLMKLIDYKPVADDFDAKAAKKVLMDLKESDPYLFGEEPAAATGQRNGSAPLNPAVAGLGSALGRGSSPGPLENQALKEEELRDPVFMSQYHAKQRAGK